MAKWRAEAIKRLPELQTKIAEAPQIMYLWIELFSEFEKAYRREPRDESLIARIYDFADWCIGAPSGSDAGHDPITAVMVAFYEDVPRCYEARLDMPRWFTYDQVRLNKETFAYHIGDVEYEALLAHMAKNKKSYRDRSSCGKA